MSCGGCEARQDTAWAIDDPTGLLVHHHTGMPWFPHGRRAYSWGAGVFAGPETRRTYKEDMYPLAGYFSSDGVRTSSSAAPAPPDPLGLNSITGAILKRMRFHLFITPLNGTCGYDPCVEITSCAFVGWLAWYVDFSFPKGTPHSAVPTQTPASLVLGNLGTAPWGSASIHNRPDEVVATVTYRHPDFRFEPGCGAVPLRVEISAGNGLAASFLGVGGVYIGWDLDLVSVYALNMVCEKCDSAGSRSDVGQNTGKNAKERRE